MQNLKDKLLKAGLVTTEQAAKVETPPPPAPRERPARAETRPSGASSSSRPPPRVSGYQVPIVRAAPPVPKLAPLPGSRAHQRLEALKQQEIDEQLRGIVLQAQVEIELGEQAFYFQTRKGKLRRLNLNVEQAAKLERGELAVVERQEPAAIEHSLVPAATAEKMLALFPRSVRFFNKAGSPIGFLSESERQQSVDDSVDSPSEPAPTPDTAPAESAEPEA
jgi:hypothetical protein